MKGSLQKVQSTLTDFVTQKPVVQKQVAPKQEMPKATTTKPESVLNSLRHFLFSTKPKDTATPKPDEPGTKEDASTGLGNK